MMKKISLSSPAIDDADIAAVTNVLKSGWLTQGPKVKEFEVQFAAMHQTKYAIAVNSATSGLHIALLALDVKPGDEVIVPAFSWVATANAIELCGATPIFVDIDLSSFNANISKIIEKITPKTKVILPVHLFGKPFDVLKLIERLPRPIPILEDAACAAGAKLRNQACGSIGNAAVFSFHPRKSITTGEGGMITTNDESLYHKLLMLRNHGQQMASGHPAEMADCPIVGLNYRMTDIQAALGLSQLQKLENLIQHRKKLVNVYFEHLQDVQLPTTDPEEHHTWQTFAVLISNRRGVIEFLRDKGIETRPGTHAIHTLSYYRQKYNLLPSDYPHAYAAFLQTMALPLHNQMSPEDCVYVSHALKEALDA